MLVAVSMVLIVFGLMVLPTSAIVGLAILYGGYWVWTKSDGASEDAFIAVLMLAGGLGAIAVVVQFLLERLGFR